MDYLPSAMGWFSQCLERRPKDKRTDGHTASRGWVCSELKRDFHSKPPKIHWIYLVAQGDKVWNFNTSAQFQVELSSFAYVWIGVVGVHPTHVPMWTHCYSRDWESKFTKLRNGRKMPLRTFGCDSEESFQLINDTEVLRISFMLDRHSRDAVDAFGTVCLQRCTTELVAVFISPLNLKNLPDPHFLASLLHTLC